MTESKKSEINDILNHYEKRRENLLPILQDINRRWNYLSEESMKDISRYLNISAAEIYGVATFYSFVDTKKMGEHIIRICKTISCDMKGKDRIIETIEKKLRIKLGETTGDNRFSFLTTNCIGWCHKSPAMLIDDKVYTELTPSSVSAAIDEWL
jgi:NADH:ubiquinone oxidoreductase subunit E